MFSDVSLILMAAIVGARNELVRLAVKLDPPRPIGRPRRMSTVDTIQLILWCLSFRLSLASVSVPSR